MKNSIDSLQLSSYSESEIITINELSLTPKRHTILAVDDDEDNLLLMIYALESLSCSVITASDGQSALEKAKTCNPDLILLDIMLSQLDGLNLVRELKQCANTQSIPVIAVTALAATDDRERILKAGCNDYISKPYMLDAFEAKVCRYLKISVPVS